MAGFKGRLASLLRSSWWLTVSDAFGNLYSPSKMVAKYNIKQNKSIHTH